jgi:hypothetical protein
VFDNHASVETLGYSHKSLRDSLPEISDGEEGQPRSLMPLSGRNSLHRRSRLMIARLGEAAFKLR